jgi:hypothetical protein
MARASQNVPTRKQRQARLYEEMMGERALERQLVVRERKPRFVEPDECNCGFLGASARTYGPQHADTCPRRNDPFENAVA